MSALREENLINDKGNLFGVTDKPTTLLSGQQLSNKVMEAIPELARANHGY
jgi:hypothetical protein